MCAALPPPLEYRLTMNEVFDERGRPQLERLRAHLASEGLLTEEAALRIVHEGAALLHSEPTVLEVEAPITGLLCAYCSCAPPPPPLLRHSSRHILHVLALALARHPLRVQVSRATRGDARLAISARSAALATANACPTRAGPICCLPASLVLVFSPSLAAALVSLSISRSRAGLRSAY